MENVREHRRMNLFATEKQEKKLAAKPTFRSFKRFQENLIAVERYKCIVHLQKPIYTGFCLLDISKLLMYDFHYNYIKQKYPGEKSLFHGYGQSSVHD